MAASAQSRSSRGAATATLLGLAIVLFADPALASKTHSVRKANGWVELSAVDTSARLKKAAYSGSGGTITLAKRTVRFSIAGDGTTVVDGIACNGPDEIVDVLMKADDEIGKLELDSLADTIEREADIEPERAAAILTVLRSWAARAYVRAVDREIEKQRAKRNAHQPPPAVDPR